MTVRAKFKVQSITRHQGWDGSKMVEQSTVRLVPVTSGSDENKAFYAATPSGQIELGVISADTAAKFPIGGEMYADFTPAIPPVA